MDTGPQQQGLTSAQVAQRTERGEVNDAGRRTSRPVTDIIRANVLTRFNAIVGALCAIVLVTGHFQDGLFGLVIVANTGIGVVQELRAKRTLDRLAVLAAQPVRVVRDGVPADLPPAAIVRGDRILVASGDRVLVDGEVTDSAGLEIDESLLTGETDAVAKQPGDQLLSGSFVVSGSGAFTATRVGSHSYAARLEAEASVFSLAKSDLMAGINRFLRLITWVIVPVAGLLTASQLVFASGAFPDAVAGAVAGIITMIPEGLVLLTSVAFAVGVIRLGRRRCLVQELPAIEVLARVDVLCLDKTGTLTEAGMELDEYLELVPGTPAQAVLASIIRAEEHPNATLQAIASGLAEQLHATAPLWQPASLVPFSSARKWSGAVFTGAGPAAGGWVLGAPEVLLKPGDAALAEADAKAAEGLRVLVLGRTGPAGLRAGGGFGPDGQPVEAVALVVLRQRLRPDAPRTLAYFAEQNVAIKVISGDSAASVGAIARQLGIEGASHPVDARTLPAGAGEPPAGGTASPAGGTAPPAGGPPATGGAATPADLAGLADVLAANSVFGRVTPRQKQLFVTALQTRGHTVAMTGDGINDVLALTRADLGVAMGSGSGATRAVAKVVLMDDSFATLPHVVAEGRRVLGNIERVASLFLTKTVYAVLLSTATAVASFAYVAGLHGLRFPFLPRHLTLISTLTIGVPAFVLALAPSMQRVAPGFVSRVLRFAVPSGIACATATFTAYLLATASPGTDLAADRTTAVITLSATALWVLALVARPYSWWRIALVAAMAAGLILAMTVPLSRVFFDLRHYHPASDSIALVLAGCAGVILTIFLATSHRLPGGDTPPAGR